MKGGFSAFPGKWKGGLLFQLLVSPPRYCLKDQLGIIYNRRLAYPLMSIATIWRSSSDIP